MGKGTKIQWCDDTVNSTSGCDGCELWSLLGKAVEKSCYAGVTHEARLAHSLPDLYAEDFTEVRMIPGRMAKAVRASDLTGKDRPDKPWLNGLPRSIFVSDMSDAMSAAVTYDFLHDEIIANVTSEHGRRHRFLWLTKQPQRMAGFSSWLKDRSIDWPRNLWVGTSVTSQATTTRIKHLLNVGDDFTKRFVSAEPMFEAIDLMPLLLRLDWCIFGGQSGPHARPFDIDWARKLIAQCREAGTPAFFKQYGAQPTYKRPIEVYGPEPGKGYVPKGRRPVDFAMSLRNSHGGDWSEWAEEFRVREVPK